MQRRATLLAALVALVLVFIGCAEEVSLPAEAAPQTLPSLPTKSIGALGVVNQVLFHPNGNDIIVAAGSTLHLLDAASFEAVRRFVGHEDWIYSLAVSTDGQMLATGSKDCTVRLWNVASGEQIRTLMGHERRVISVAFSPDGEVAISGSLDKTIRRWDARTGELLSILEEHDYPVKDVAVSPDGETIALARGPRDTTWTCPALKLVNLSTGDELHRLPSRDCVTSLAFSADGSMVAYGSSDGHLDVASAASGELLRSLEISGGNASALAFSADGATLAVATTDSLFSPGELEDGSIVLWDIASGEIQGTLWGSSERVNSLVFSTDGSTLVSGSADGVVRLWDVPTGVVLSASETPLDLSGSMAFSPDGATIVAGSTDGTINAWNLSSGDHLCTLDGHESVAEATEFSLAGSGEPAFTLRTRKSDVIALAFSPDGEILASVGDDHAVRLWDAVRWESLAVLEGHTDQVTSVAFSPDGTLLATGSGDRTIKLWNVRTGGLLNTLESGLVRSLAFGLDGTTLISGFGVGYVDIVKLWDAASGALLSTWEGDGEWIGDSVAPDADGAILALGIPSKANSEHGCGIVKLWNLASNTAICTLEGPAGLKIDAFAFSSDGAIVALDSDGSVTLWDVASGTLLRTLNGHGSAESLLFSPDGSTLAAVSIDGTIKLWAIGGEASSGE